jgi:hypothetical protein
MLYSLYYIAHVEGSIDIDTFNELTGSINPNEPDGSFDVNECRN